MINVLFIAVGEGGSDQALVTLIKELKNKINPYVTLGKLASQATIEKLKTENIPYSVLNYDFFWYPAKKNLWKYITLPIYALRIRYLKKIFTKQIIYLSKLNNIDIIHTNSSAYQFGFAAAQLLNIPHIWHLREYQSLDFGHRHAYSLPYLKRLLNKTGNFNIAITKGIYDFYQLRKENSVTIYDGVLSQDYKPQEPHKENYFLFVGRIVKEKGIFTLLNSYMSYLHTGGSFNLVLVGNYHPKIKQKIDILRERHKIQNKIIFKGTVTTKQVYDLMNHAKALIVPSPFEAFGLITAEAMFNKCLVIGKDTGGTKEQFDNGKKMHNKEIAMRFINEKQLTSHLMEVELKNYSYYAETIQKAYESVLKKYSIEHNANLIERLYEFVIKAKP